MTEIALPRMGELREMAAQVSADIGIELTVRPSYRGTPDGGVEQVEGYCVAFRPSENGVAWYSELDWYAASAVISAFEECHKLTGARS
jgi:hypothetical protein